VQRGVRCLMNKIYLDELRDKTHRGPSGQAIKKFRAGGKPYGYRVVQLKDENRVDSYSNPEVIGTLHAREDGMVPIAEGRLLATGTPEPNSLNWIRAITCCSSTSQRGSGFRRPSSRF